MYSILFIIVFLPAISLALKPLRFEKCPTGATPIEVRSKFCDVAPCTFKQGESIGFEMDFISGVDTNTIKVSAIAKLGILTINYDIPPEHQDACKTLQNRDCPVKKGEKLIYEMDMPLKAPMTNIKPTLRVSLNSDKKKPIVCFAIKVIIIN